jgi:hypothetical protein
MTTKDGKSERSPVFQLENWKEPAISMYYLPNCPLPENDLCELAAGRVPGWLREQAREMVEWSLASGPVSYRGLAESQQHQRHPQKRGS